MAEYRQNRKFRKPTATETPFYLKLKALVRQTKAEKHLFAFDFAHACYMMEHNIPGERRLEKCQSADQLLEGLKSQLRSLRDARSMVRDLTGGIKEHDKSPDSSLYNANIRAIQWLERMRAEKRL